MESEFQIVADAESRTVVVLRGVVDARNAPRAREAIRCAARPGPVGVDVAGLSEIDSSGVRALLAEAADARRLGRRLQLWGARPPLLDRLYRSGWLSLFGFDSVSDSPLALPKGTVRIVWKEERFQTPAEIRFLPDIRHRITRFCRQLGIDDDTLDSIHLGAGEAVTNAIRHGCCDNACLIVEVHCAASHDRVVLEVRDPGPGFDPDTVTPPDPGELRPGGMGICLMRAMMDEVEFSFTDDGTIARLVKRIGCLANARLIAKEEGLSGVRVERSVDE